LKDLNVSRIKKIHSISSLILTFFIVVHLVNHLIGIVGIETHRAFMEVTRLVYRNIVVESILIGVVALQIVTGLVLVWKLRKSKKDFWRKLQFSAGLYLAFFFIIHISAVMVIRHYHHIDTNFYVAAGSFLIQPWFFIPYYFMAIISFFIHLGSGLRMQLLKKQKIAAANIAALTAIMLATAVSIVIIFVYTEAFYPIHLPKGIFDLFSL